MTEEIQEIERLIRQSAEFGESLIRLTRKWQERTRHQERDYEDVSESLRTLSKSLTDLRSYIDVAEREIRPHQHYSQDETYADSRAAVADGTLTPQEAAIELLRAGVADKTVTPDFAVEQLAKLLRADLPVSRRIEIRQIAKAALESGDDVVSKVRRFLKGARQQRLEQQRAWKTLATTP
jgi:hypothetical protein